MNMAGQEWPDFIGHRHEETNPLMGKRPTPGIVASYFLTATVLNWAAWVVTPERYRAILPSALTATEAYQIFTNTGNGTGLCGF